MKYIDILIFNTQVMFLNVQTYISFIFAVFIMKGQKASGLQSHGFFNKKSKTSNHSTTMKQI